MASGRGSTVRAIAEAVESGRCAVTLVGVVTDKPGAPVVELSAELGLRVSSLPLRRGDDRTAWDTRLADALSELKPDLVVLAGFMRILGPQVVSRFAGRVLNVHPSLLPSFPGKDAPGQAMRAGVAVAGCTVHLVDEGVDSGTILGQAALPVREDDDAHSLHARIQELERWLYPAVIDAFAHGRHELNPPPADRANAPAVFALSPAAT